MDRLTTVLLIVAIILTSGLAAAINVEITADPVESTVGEPVNINVVVLDNLTPQNNTLVNFTTTLGSLSTTSAYTDETGTALVTLNATTSGTAVVNASVDGVYNETSVTLLPGEPSNVLINISQNPVVVGNTTLVNLTLADQYDNVNITANVSLNLTITDLLGEVRYQVNLTKTPGTLTYITASQGNLSLANTTYNASVLSLSIKSTIAGNITLAARAGNSTNTTTVIFTASLPQSLTALYDATCTVNTTTEVIVGVYDEYGNPVSGIALHFNATPPPDTKYNSPIEYNSLRLTPTSNTTDYRGLASTLFTVDKRAGANTINITVANTTMNTTVTITGVADAAENLLLTYTPESAYANNRDTYTVSAQSVDRFLNPVLPECCPIKEQVLFTTATGSTLVPLNESGTATTRLGPTPYVETVSITATYKNESGYTDIINTTNLSFVAGSLASFSAYFNPTAVLTQNLSGNHNSTLTLTALDEWGHALPNINVTLNNTNTSLGTLTLPGANATNQINATTDASGRIQAVFTSKYTPGNATVTLTNGSVSASATVIIRDQPFLSVNITAEPENVDSGDIVNVTTIISVEGELPLTRPAASALLVLDRSGSMDPDYYAGTPLDVVLVLDRSGSMDDDGCSGAVCQPITDAKNASKAFMENLVSNSEVAVVSYSTDVTIDIGLTPLNSTSNQERIRRAIDIIDTGGWTNMGDAIYTANDLLINGRSYARKVQVVLTDGKWNTGVDPMIPASEAADNGIVIYTIGLGSDVNEAELASIARETGGSYYHAPSSDDLLTIYNAIAQEITDYDVTEREYGVDGFTPYTSWVDSLELTPVFNVSFEGYDFDTSFTYNGETLGEVLVAVNGENLTDIPPPLGVDGEWLDYEYNITDYIINGSNNISFYDHHALLGLGEWTNSVRSVRIYENNSLIGNCPAEQSLTDTAYNCSFNASITRSVLTHTFNLSDTVDDLKVELNWSDPLADLDLQLRSPSGETYGFRGNTTGYHAGSVSEYVWVTPVSGEYASENGSVETGLWVVNVTGKGGVSSVNFTVTVYVDKKSAVKTASHEFISSFDEATGDRAGLVLYSYSNVTTTSIQSSFLRNDSTWVGYFTGGTPQKSYTLNFTGRDCDTPYNGYGECYITVNGAYVTSMPPPDVSNGETRTYTVDITDFIQNGSNNVSFYDYHNISGSNWWNDIKDVEIFENGSLVASYQPSWVDLTATPRTYSFNATFNTTTFNLTWDNPMDNLDLYLYRGAALINYSNNTVGFEELSAPLYSGYSYHVVVEGVNVSAETRFNLTVSQALDWQEWHAMLASSLNNDSLSHLNNSIDTITADGLTAIDEGMYVANNELSSVTGNSTMVLMTDGLDNAGYNSLMLEAQRAVDNNTRIYTIGFGNSESEVDPVLSEIANITGGEYYFAPNASVLRSIFRGIAANITNFTAEGPVLNLHIPHNYITNLSLATATYVANSSNATTGNATSFTPPTYPNRSNAEPSVTTVGNETILTWSLPSLEPGEQWGVWYQLRVEGTGYVPLILPSSNITYIDVNGTNITVNITYGGGTSLGGSGADVNYLALGSMQISADPTVVLIGEPATITITAAYDDGNPAIANVTVHTNLGYIDTTNIVISGSDVVNFTSAIAGRASISAVGWNGNNSLQDRVVVVVRPKGKITIS